MKFHEIDLQNPLMVYFTVLNFITNHTNTDVIQNTFIHDQLQYRIFKIMAFRNDAT